MPHAQDHYATLGVPRTASQDEIKRAYRKLAKQYHPDRNPDDPSAEAKFKEVQHAYGILSDPQKRAEYDRFGEAAVGRFNTDPRGRKVYQWGTNSTINAEDLEDLFSAFAGGGEERPSVFDEFFGGSGRQRRGGRRRPHPTAAPERGADAERTITLTFDQAANGAVVTAQLGPRGNGKPGTLDVRIPAGVEEGQRIRLAGRGHPGRDGGPPGDFYLVCHVKPHPFFRRQEADVYLDVPISVSEAALGAKVEVPTLDGRATVSIPPGTPSGAKLRLKGRGLKKGAAGERGDQYIVVGIVPPKPVTDQERRLFEQLREQQSGDPRASCGWHEPAVE